MKRIYLPLLAVGLMAFASRAPSAEEEPPKWVFTHAMGMMPSVNWWGANNLFPLNDFALTKDPMTFALFYGGTGRTTGLGFFYAFLRDDSTYNFNEPYQLWYERNQAHLHPDFSPYDKTQLDNRYLWDLEQAEEMGIDGFGLCLSGNEPSYQHAVHWITTLESMLQKKPETQIRLTMIICGDDLPSETHPEKYSWLRRFMSEFKDSPAWLRYDGRMVIMGYHNHISWRIEDGLDPDYMKGAIARHQAFIKSLDVENPFIIFDGPEYVLGQITDRTKLAQPEDLRPIVAMVAQAFDGYSCWGGIIPDEVYTVNYTIIADEVNRHDKIWMMPILNMHSGVGQFYRSLPGVQRFLDTWNFAESSGARAVQLVTWNDTTEATGFQPSISLNYALASLTAKYIHRFKQGSFPEPKHDQVYLFYRKYHADADPYLYPRCTVERDTDRWGENDDLLHVFVFAIEDGVMEVSGTADGVTKCPVVKGFNEFKLVTAVNRKIAARIYRDGKLAHELISPEQVTDHPYREDLIPWGWSSDCRRRYDEDFGPGFRPVSFYSQRYQDGIPDWFRLHYFGTTELPQGGLATEDPDGDGVDNLNEYLAAESPLEPNPIYAPGYKWNELPQALSVVTNQPFAARINQNPYPDKNGHLVHTFLYKTDGELNGVYPHMMKWVNEVPGTPTCWTMRSGARHRYFLTEDQALGMDLLPGWAGIYRFWPPVTGRIHITCRLNGDPNQPVDFYIKQGTRELFSAGCAPGQELSIDLEVEVNAREGIDFIVRGPSSVTTTITLQPEITLLNLSDKPTGDVDL